MKVYLHFSSRWHYLGGWEKRLEGIYATRQAAKNKMPKNPNTSNREHWIESKTVKGE